MNFLDRAMNILQRGYEGAKVGRRTDGWRTPGSGSNSEIATALPRLRDRSRDLVRNNPYAAKGVNALVCNLVGSGLKARARFGETALNDTADKLWTRFPLIRFAVDTGGRLSELLELDWNRVDLVNKRVMFTKTKNGEDRTVRLCDRAQQTLVNLGPNKTGPVFTYKGKAMKRVKTSFDTAREKAGLEDVRFHDLRHTFASRLVQGGVPLYDVMNLAGHKSLQNGSAVCPSGSRLSGGGHSGAQQPWSQFGHSGNI